MNGDSVSGTDREGLSGTAWSQTKQGGNVMIALKNAV
jgi:hypothetical protein